MQKFSCLQWKRGAGSEILLTEHRRVKKRSMGNGREASISWWFEKNRHEGGYLSWHNKVN